MNIFNFRKKYFISPKEKHVSNAGIKNKIQDLNFSVEHHGMDLVNLPFECSLNEVIYFEIEYDEATNRIIRENIDFIRDCFAKANLRFIYLPLIGKEIAEDKQYWKYISPSSKDIRAELPSLSNDYIFQFLAETDNNYQIGKTSLIRYNTTWDRNIEDKHNHSIFDIYSFNINEADDIKKYFDFLCKQTKQLKCWNEDDFGIPFICVYECHKKPKDADEAFDEETKYLLKEVEYKIDLLRRKGISQVVLDKLVKPEQKLSRLVVTKDFRIILPDYGNMEIEMTPLVRAVFLLFLKHPEGILFKELPDYRLELAEIYGKIKGARFSRNLFGIRKYDKSIVNATDPLNNSINEKCARIREAFLLKFHEGLAENYFVTGKRGEPKMIKLSKDLIKWEE